MMNVICKMPACHIALGIICFCAFLYYIVTSLFSIFVWIQKYSFLSLECGITFFSRSLW